MNLGVLDYGAGNLRSVLNAFAALGRPARLVRAPADFAGLDLLVFPGQGAFGDASRILRERELWPPLKTWLAEERPYIGICLGYQLLFESSEENPGVEGLGVARGTVKRFSPESGLKIPHMGWNTVQWSAAAAPYRAGLPDACHLYFVHSYYPDVQDPGWVACTTDYGVNFASGIVRRNLLAVQFHPEKSQAMGLKLLGNAVSVLEKGAAAQAEALRTA